MDLSHTYASPRTHVPDHLSLSLAHQRHITLKTTNYLHITAKAARRLAELVNGSNKPARDLDRELLLTSAGLSCRFAYARGCAGWISEEGPVRVIYGRREQVKELDERGGHLWFWGVVVAELIRGRLCWMVPFLRMCTVDSNIRCKT